MIKDKMGGREPECNEKICLCFNSSKRERKRTGSLKDRSDVRASKKKSKCVFTR